MEFRLEMLTSLSASQIERLVSALREPQGKGRPWGFSRRRRVLLVCTALRTNLTFRELAAIFRTSKSAVHRIVDRLCQRIGRLRFGSRKQDRRFSWVLDGTLVPTRDHAGAAKSKNYRWSCNLQVLVRRRDLRVIAVGGGGPGNRKDPLHYRAAAPAAAWPRPGPGLSDRRYPRR